MNSKETQELYEKLMFLKEEMTEFHSGDNDYQGFVDYLQVLDSITFCLLGDKAAYNTLNDSRIENDVSDKLHKLYSVFLLVFSDAEQDRMYDMVKKSIEIYYASDANIATELQTKEDKVINGPLPDLRQHLIEQPWYFISILAVI